MLINVKEYLIDTLPEDYLKELQLPDVQIDKDKIECIIINEVPPKNPDDGFYGNSADPDYMRTTRELFQAAGVHVNSISEILDLGIYITTAVKIPKQQYTVPRELISQHLPLLEKEIELFPNIKVIMLMGDVAKTAFNEIAKRRTSKRVIPSGSTYKIRGLQYYYGQVRVFPSYIMTGGNILIEKSKRNMISEDIKEMMKILQ
jgi:uracil-DNA glycosylase